MKLKGKQLTNHTITQDHLSLTTPVNTSDAATKEYVDKFGIPIESSTWNGSILTLDLSYSHVVRRSVNSGVNTLTISLNLPTDGLTTSREIILEIDNSANATAISSIVFDTGSSTYTWRWAVGVMPSGMAANSIGYLSLYNVSNTIVKANWEIIA